SCAASGLQRILRGVVVTMNASMVGAKKETRWPNTRRRRENSAVQPDPGVPLTTDLTIRRTQMESRAKLLGHPIHPMLVVLPLGLFIGAVVFDALSLWRGSPAMAQVGFWNIAAGIVGGLLAAVFGLVDWLAIPAGTRAKRI